MARTIKPRQRILVLRASKAITLIKSAAYQLGCEGARDQRDLAAFRVGALKPGATKTRLRKRLASTYKSAALACRRRPMKGNRR